MKESDSASSFLGNEIDKKGVNNVFKRQEGSSFGDEKAVEEFLKKQDDKIEQEYARDFTFGNENPQDLEVKDNEIERQRYSMYDNAFDFDDVELEERANSASAQVVFKEKAPQQEQNLPQQEQPSKIVKIQMKVPPENQFWGTEEERLKEEQEIEAAFNSQQTLEDKILFFCLFQIKQMMNADPIHHEVSTFDGMLELNRSIPEEERKHIADEVQKEIDRTAQWRKDNQLHPSPGINSEQEDRLIDKFQNAIMKEIVGNGTKASFMRGMQALNVVNSYCISQVGKAYTEVKKELAKSKDSEALQEHKAKYMVNEASNTLTARLLTSYQQFQQYVTSELSQLEANDLGGLGTKIFDALHFNKQMKLSTYLMSLGLTTDEKILYLKEKGLENSLGDLENINVYTIFEQELKNDGNQKPSYEEVCKLVYRDYTTRIVQKVINANIGDLSQTLNQTLDENMTMGHFMNFMQYSDEEKKVFLREQTDKQILLQGKPVTVTADTPVLGFFQEEIKKNEAYKRELRQTKINQKFSEAEIDQITEADVKNYIVEIMKREMARHNFKDYFYKDSTTVEHFLNSIGYDEKEKNDFCEKHLGVTLQTKVKDVFRAELVKGKTQEEVEKVTDQEVEDAAARFMEEEIEKLRLLGRKLPQQNISQEVRDEVMRSQELAEERNAYKKGIEILEANGTRPKEKPKTQVEQEFKEWVDKTGQSLVANKWWDDGTKTLAFLNTTLKTKKELNLLGKKEISKYMDSTTLPTNTTFLRGVIAALEETKQGSGIGHSENTSKYDAMLMVLKFYEEKISQGDLTGIKELQNTLKNVCMDYIKKRKSTRWNDFGNKRFNAVSTVLYEIMPKDEFVRWMNDVNTHRGGADRLSFGVCADREAEYFMKEQARQEQAQVDATKNRIKFPDEYSARLGAIESVYGLQPQYLELTYNGVFNRQEFSEKLKPLEKTEVFVRIGESSYNINLSNKDFVAIAYAGTLTPEAAAKDPRLKDFGGDKLLITGKDYTTELGKKEISKECGKYLDVIATGRNAAIHAMNEYAAGDKMPLAYILASGIRFIAAAGRETVKLTDDLYANAEMGLRIVGMLERDPQLKKMALRDIGVKNLEGDFQFIKSMGAMSQIHCDSQLAMERFKSLKADNAKGQKEEKENLLTDILLEKVIEKSSEKEQEKRATKEMYQHELQVYQSTYQNAEKSFNKGLEALEEEINKKHEEATNPSSAHSQAEKFKVAGQYNALVEKKQEFMEANMVKKAEDVLKVQTAILNDRYRDHSLLKSLYEKEKVDALRAEVRKLVKDSGLAKQSAAQILKELKGEKILGKIATLSQKAREKNAPVIKNTAKKTTTKTTKKVVAHHK